MNTQQSQSVFPRFYFEAVEDKPESLKQNRPIFKDVEYVEIMIAGDKSNVPVHKVTDVHRNRWPQQYESFKKGQEAVLEGTPIGEWSVLTASKVKELKALNVLTVEALAEINDAFISRLGMGGRDLVKKAKHYLETTKDQGGLNSIIDRMTKLEAENEALKQQVAKGGIHA